MNSIVGKGSYKLYLLGFIISLLLTFAAYLVVSKSLFSGWVLYSTISFLALVQAWVQLSIFLNLGKEGKPHWNVITFLFMAAVTVIVVFLSLWIMNELNYNLMAP
jgi:cytochrome o ubiquinol oxidase operon protein cyoD